jgi:hypothetical protein
MKGGNMYFGSQFLRVQFMVAWSQALGQNIMVVGACSPYIGQEAVSETGEAMNKTSTS